MRFLLVGCLGFMGLQMGVFAQKGNAPHAAKCTISVSGQVLETESGQPLPYANIRSEKDNRLWQADSLGRFRLDSLCAIPYRLQVSHIGCETLHESILSFRDTSIYLFLQHRANTAPAVEIFAQNKDNQELSQSDISQSSHKNLADVLAELAGVSVLKNGSGVSKPIVQGLSGNRVTILNNGVSQAGQQWGNDHAPEIDAFAADGLRLLRGVKTFAYNVQSLSGLVMVEVQPLPMNALKRSELNQIFASNGFGHTLNFRTQRSTSKGWAYKLGGSLKLQGDTHTPDYFLTNTGKREGNFSAQIEKKTSERRSFSFYYSLFSTQLGILRGSHIGNLTDLRAAITREEPFFTAPDFSYALQAPKQQVLHHLLKLENTRFGQKSDFWRFRYAAQLNQRQEYDVRRNSQNKAPTLSLLQHTHLVDIQYFRTFTNAWNLQTGTQLGAVQNQNRAGTGIYPLIPDYWGANGAVFATLDKKFDRLRLEMGGRYELKYWSVGTYAQQHYFQNAGLGLGLEYVLGAWANLAYEGGYAVRTPEINELYSFGLHQGVSGIEEGNRNLRPETAFKNTLSLQIKTPKGRLQAHLAGFYQYFPNYIYLQPQSEFRLTIRGAFPVFRYEDASAQILGTYLNLNYLPNKYFQMFAKYSLTRGQNRSLNLPLVAMPSDNLTLGVDCFLPDFYKFGKNYVKLKTLFVDKQSRLLPEQDFLNPPPAYFLVNAQIGTSLALKTCTLNFSLAAENLLNQRYRDYLNRQRYFANEMGRNFVWRCNIVF